jgi:hypothetical protein
MDNRKDTAIMTGFGPPVLLMVYVTGHMLYNQYHGPDEPGRLFRFKEKNKNKI